MERIDLGLPQHDTNILALLGGNEEAQAHLNGEKT